MIYRIFFFFLFLVLMPLDGQGDEKVYYHEDSGPSNRITIKAERPKAEPTYNFFTIHELNKKKLTYGTYEIIGFVIKKYTCSPCPLGASCMPCMKPHIIVSDEFRIINDYDKMSDEDMVIFVDDTASFSLGKKYKMLIHILDLKTMDQPVNDPKLIYYEKIEAPI